MRRPAWRSGPRRVERNAYSGTATASRYPRAGTKARPASTSPASATSTATPKRVPPARTAPATIGSEAAAPSSPPIAPATASPQSPTRRPIPIPAATASNPARATRTPVRPSGISAPIATPAPVPRPAATPIQYQEPMRMSLGGFEPPDHGQTELGRARAVDDTVVEGDRNRPCGPHGDLSVTDDRPQRDPPHAEDRDLGVVDDGRVEETAELPGARDGEGRAAQ